MTMDWMSPMDASFLHIEGPMTPMHIGGVSIFEGPAALRAPGRDGRGQARPRAALPPEGALHPLRAGASGVGRRPALQPAVSPAPLGAATAGIGRAAAGDGGAHL